MARATKSHDVADLTLAEPGQRRIDWADRQMPVLRSVRERFERERPLDGITIACCLHVTAETAGLIRALLGGGAEVVLCASNPLSTQDDVAAALVENSGADVHAVRGEDSDTYYRHIGAAVDRRPQITMDDGADVISVLHAERPDQLAEVMGGTEETTTGVIRLRALEAEGRLGFPVIAVNGSATKQLFDNRYGTGQSTLDGIMRATNTLIAGQTVVVVGYGWCGRGIALRAAGLGAAVIVCEVDPVRALEAHMDGHRVMRGADAAVHGDVFVAATGNRDVIAGEMFDRMKDGAIVANAGHFDVEVSKTDLRERSVSRREARPLVEAHTFADGREINLLADGRVVNLAAAEGHPPAVMDVAFAIQALAAEWVVRGHVAMEPRVHVLPAEIDAEIARLKLASNDVEIDELSAEQRSYMESWELGT